ncbi:hypothetical protein B7H23_04645 [Notoacmeibacter marinus]|uniref:AAA+ ATPase domain-containing protein n=1 Tax=Notoacmeibacter marinus TaxID=1876515 RepID=A0A231V1Y5_9HYPH|nr:ATP-binding protein [Notoacmeibacter marinus]OXT02209.1 hypothetical protein B7H23_04645 [Notoacmeibacter marinus]
MNVCLRCLLIVYVLAIGLFADPARADISNPELERIATEAAKLDSSFRPVVQYFDGDRTVDGYYFVDLYRVNAPNRIEFGGRVLIEEKTGKPVTDEATLRFYSATSDQLPDGIDPSSRLNLNDMDTLGRWYFTLQAYWKSIAAVSLFFIGLFVFRKWVAGLFDRLFRKKGFRIEKISSEAVFVWAFGIQIAGMVLCFIIYPDKFLAVILLTSSLGTLTFWAANRGNMNSEKESDTIWFDTVSENGAVEWDKIAIDDNLRLRLEKIVKIMRDPQKAIAAGVTLPRGMLLYGPPGTGKTVLARVLATESKCAFAYISASDILSKWIGNSEKNVRELFSQARSQIPCIIFIDEIDSLARERGSQDVFGDKVLNQILQEIDGVLGVDGVFVIGATNRPDQVDKAFVRAGRLSIHVEVPLPNLRQREKLFALYSAKFVDAALLDTEQLALKSEGFSPADIKEICSNIMLERFAVDRHEDPISTNEFFEEIVRFRGGRLGSECTSP